LPRFRIVLLIGVAWYLMAASVAAAARLTIPKPCYPEGSHELAFTGQGFEPGAAYTLRVDGAVVRSGTVGPGGEVTGSGLRVPPAGGRLRAVRVTLSDGATSVSAVIRISPFDARLNFLGGLQVRVFVHGFGSQRAVFLHYVSPAGIATRTIRLGETTGACGSLLSPPQPIFPFVPGPGTWVLQVDGHSAYRRRPPAPVVRIEVLVLRD
jgi:hypothetical protein